MNKDEIQRMIVSLQLRILEYKTLYGFYSLPPFIYDDLNDILKATRKKELPEK